MSGQSKSIVKHRIWGLGKSELCKKIGEPILAIYMSFVVFLHKELSFGGRGDCTCIKIFSGNNFVITINSLTP